MAPKGKRLWRKTIDTSEIDAAIEKETLAKRKVAKVDQVPDGQLFYVDKANDDVTVEAMARGGPIRRGVIKKTPKLLKCQVILNAAHSAKPVIQSATKPRKLKGPAFKKGKSSTKPAVSGREVVNATESSSAVDLWEGGIIPRETRAEATKHRPRRQSKIQAVEIDQPGCSFNPDTEQHQDAVAEAVAAEMSKIYAKEHIPQAPRVFNHMPDMGELQALLDTGGDDEEEVDSDGEEGGKLQQARPSGPGILARKLQGKKTQTDRNKQKRQRDAEAAVQGKKDLKKQRRELDRVKEIVTELTAEEQIQAAQQARREIDLADKALIRPPRLGKHKFEAPSVQVLLSEEIDGSLRRLKGTPMLTKDRFKNLQKRGVIEPRVRLEKRERRKAIVYQTGDRVEKAVAGNEEVKDLVQKIASAPQPKSGKPKKGRKRR